MPHRPAQGSRAGQTALQRAQEFVGIVREEGPDGIGAYLDALDRDALYGLVVGCAAMVPLDQTPSDLLAWLLAPQQLLSEESA